MFLYVFLGVTVPEVFIHLELNIRPSAQNTTLRLIGTKWTDYLKALRASRGDNESLQLRTLLQEPDSQMILGHIPFSVCNNLCPLVSQCPWGGMDGLKRNIWDTVQSNLILCLMHVDVILFFLS